MSVEKVLSPTDGSVIGYKVRWRDSQGTSRRKTVRLWRDAVALDAEIKRKKVMGELVTHEKGKITLDDFWEVWCRNYSQNVTARTLDGYTRLYKKHVAPALGSTQIRQIGTEDVAALVAGINQKLASTSTRKCIAVLHSILQRAVEWGYIATNPATGVRKPRLVQRVGHAISSDQIHALAAELDLRGSTIVRCLAGTGIRPGELRALKWEDIRDDTILITKAVSNDVVGPTKTNRLRSVRPAVDAVAALQEWSLASGRPGPGALVLPSPRGGLWTDNAYRLWAKNVFSPAANRAGLKGLRPYDLRHTFASQQIAAGADILTLAAQLGHSPTMTLTVYGHLLGSRHEPATLPGELLAGLHGA